MLRLKPPRPGKTPYWSVRGTYLGIHVDRSTKAVEERIARKVRDRIKDEIERGVFADRPQPTFLSAALIYMKAGGERRFVGPLLEHFRETPLADIDQAAIDNAAAVLYPEASPATLNRQVYTPVSAILKRGGVEFEVKRPKGPTSM